MNASVPRPRGITIEVTAPRWPLRLASIVLGLLVVALLVSVGAAVVMQTTSGGGSSSSAGGGVTAAVRSGNTLTIEAQLGQEGDTSPLRTDGWTLLMDDGSIVPGAVVDGPAEVRSGENVQLSVAFQLPGDANPAWVRFDAGTPYAWSFPLSVNNAR